MHSEWGGGWGTAEGGASGFLLLVHHPPDTGDWCRTWDLSASFDSEMG